ncbi:MAG: hypothetical protein R3C44_16895 [Chloroflexota bacterium]
MNRRPSAACRRPDDCPAITRAQWQSEANWYAVNIVVRKNDLFRAIGEPCRAIAAASSLPPAPISLKKNRRQYRAMLEKLAESG